MGRKPEIIILDANVLVKERFLASAVGLSLRYYARRSGLKFCILDIVATEAGRAARQLYSEAREKVVEGLTTIQSILGARPRIDLSEAESEVDRAVSERIADVLADSGVRDKHSRADLEAALGRLLVHRAPSVKGEEFRDCVIWEQVKRLGRKCDIVFITQDKGFWEQGKAPRVFCDVLHSEFGVKGRKLRAFEGVAEFLKTVDLATTVPDDQRLLDAIDGEIREAVDVHARSKGLQTLSCAFESKSIFITERPDWLAIEFKLGYDCEGVGEDAGGKHVGRLLVAGEGMYKSETGVMKDVFAGGMEFYDGAGTPVPERGRQVFRKSSPYPDSPTTG